eukprot:CAMPEP_0119308050 /NCGR_PEP_ID=MMETSP1333-20130426/8376_1 /TAXON_ID=418940 /ORGANISM="Scyphosphaera apsteinii, Strain RCC1455" /LENGTH=117 /DNA_ID=CAMNT_0007311741 /DNA_START=417 /DNA_END=767 /DNA_ORIENTATION=-
MARRQPAVSSVKVVLLGRNVVQQNITQNHADGYGVCGVDSWYVADGRCPSLPLVGKTYAAKVPDPEISPSMTPHGSCVIACYVYKIAKPEHLASNGMTQISMTPSWCLQYQWQKRNA